MIIKRASESTSRPQGVAVCDAANGVEDYDDEDLEESKADVPHPPCASIPQAFKVLRPETHRVAGIVLNKVDLNQLQEYDYRGRYHTAPLATI
jgi:hypothetical protein